MRYRDLSSEDFDAIVTGELTHYAIWMEGALIDIISRYFVEASKRPSFERLLLRREGLTFQDKIEIIRAMTLLLGDEKVASELPQLLKRVEDFKTQRNTLAHGVDATPQGTKGEIHIEAVTRSGKERRIVVTPESHEAMTAEAENLLRELHQARDQVSA